MRGATVLRLLPLLAFALLPAAVAAPVPTGGRTEFGGNGLVTRAELEKVKFEPPPAHRKDRFGWWEPGDPPGKEPTKAAVAVHMPWHTFREGEAVPAYFVLKNGGDRDLSLDGRLDLYGPSPAALAACAIGVYDLNAGKPLDVVSRTNWSERGPLLVVPGGGFYCVRYDVGHTAEGTPLPPGEYEVEWKCAGQYSAPAKFTVTKRDDGARLAAVGKRERAHFFRLTPGRKSERRPEKVGEPFAWSASRLDRVYAGDIHAALAAGVGGVYAPDLYAIPEADKLVRASVDWKRYRDGDRVAVTLTSVDPKQPVRFLDRPHLHLHFRATEFGDLPAPPAEKPADLMSHSGEVLVTPLTIEAKLPANWLEWTGAHGSSRVAVLVTSGEVVLPRDRLNARRAKDVVKKPGGPVWEGVLLTPFSEPRFPPPAFNTRPAHLTPERIHGGIY
jgi:hypothetical protein